ncbi:MAG TPA: M28 family peptidase [Solirubrobacteraceae bacterium]
MAPPPPLTEADLELVARLAALPRPPASAGARRAAELVAARLGELGLTVRMEAERVHGTYWWPLGLATGAAALAAAPGRGLRPLRAAVAALAALAAADDLDGRRLARRALPRGRAYNVLAEAGPAGAPRTLVLHAHHDAARTGLVFHPALAKTAARCAGGLIDRVGSTPAPLWGAVAGPALVAAGALAGHPGARAAGGALSAGYAAAMADIGSSPPVPGANDNLSGVAALLAVARSLARRPPADTRVILLSTGAEEAFLAGMERFVARHRATLAPARTTFLCLESVGSPRLLLLDGEGLLRLHRYPPEPSATLARLAEAHGIPLDPPFRLRFATDGQVPLRAGYPAAALVSLDWYRAPSNYHWPSDRPENLALDTVAAAARLAEAYVRHVDRRTPPDEAGQAGDVRTGRLGAAG